MRAVFRRRAKSGGVALFVVVLVVLVLQTPGVSQGLGRGEDRTLTYSHGQSVVPIYHGWMENPDGTFDLFFSYINRNWQEEVDIPVGPDNNIQPAPYGPDGGQPTHFFPRINRWQFSVRVPKDFGSKEIIWTLTAHGQTNRAYATLNPGYVVDEFLIQHEFGNSERGHKRPTLQVEGPKQRAVKVGQPSMLVAVATDPNIKPTPRGFTGGGPVPNPTGELRPGTVGGDFVRGTARGLRLAWFVYRGAGEVTFDPPIPFKVWEDQRGGSPWAPGWQPPPVPPGNKWVHNVTFKEPGTYVIRAQTHDGYLYANEDITFTVTR